MKSTKKLLALLLSALLLLSLLPAAFATGAGEGGTTDAEANPTTDNQKFHLNITNTYPKHVFELYQVFTGTLHTDTTQADGVETTIRYLSDIAFGTAWTNTTGKDISTIVDKFKTSADNNWNVLVAENGATPKLYDKKICAEGVSTVTFDNLDAGYYIAREVTPSDVMGNVTYSSVIVQVVENANVASKHGTATSQKKVMDTNDSTGETTGWQDSADYDIGDNVPFQLTATVAKNILDFKGPYALTFHDKQSEGLTFNPDSVVVKIDGKTVFDGYSVYADSQTDGCTFHVEFEDLKTYNKEGQTPVVTKNSVITVEYTSRLNEKAKIGSEGNPNEMHITFSNNPNSTGPDPEENGKTPVDKVIVFTFLLDVWKYDGTEGANKNSPLEGAEFELYKVLKDGTEKFVKKITKDDALDPNYLNGIPEGVTGTLKFVYRFKGLDDGTYKLVETKAPDGYNTAEPVTFEITATHEVESADPKLLTLNVPEPFTKLGQTIKVDYYNYRGNTLPSTGGMGTTVFYVLGSILAVGAAILLVSKKRMNGAR